MAYAVNGTTLETLEDKVTSTVHTIIEIAVGLGSSLNAIERNSSEAFWWTSWALAIVLGLFILNLLVRVRAQLVKLNDYQSTFKKMWAEDRANEARIRREEKRERYIQLMDRGLDPRQAGQAVDSIGSDPDRENEEYQDWVAGMRDTLGIDFDD
ncbi:hypothetical protein F5Y14DRAFT_464112 [Nemania sp. NC0429]|nr:hypothetical protein F5Y14DRAFT_464112 [Nemania sp. NC0429]